MHKILQYHRIIKILNCNFLSNVKKINKKYIRVKELNETARRLK